jgi:Holliday junction resolvase RusA-like endonuclease
MTIRFTVIGLPAPQGSKTPWGSEANPRTRPWRAAVAEKAAQAVDVPLTGPVSVIAEFYFPRPKSHYGGKNANVLKASAPVFVEKKPDADKLARAIGDSLSGVVVRDDAQIAAWWIVKRYGEPARVELRVATLP